MLPSLLLAPWLGSVAVAAVATATDLRSGRIPNALTYPALVAGPAWHAGASGTAGLLEALAGLVVAGLLPVLLHRRGAMGGGDVKLFAALGGLLGAHRALDVQWLSLSLAALYALALASYRGRLGATLRVLWQRAASSPEGSRLPDGVPQHVRMGGAILLACLLVWLVPSGPWP